MIGTADLPPFLSTPQEQSNRTPAKAAVHEKLAGATAGTETTILAVMEENQAVEEQLAPKDLRSHSPLNTSQSQVEAAEIPFSRISRVRNQFLYGSNGAGRYKVHEGGMSRLLTYRQYQQYQKNEGKEQAVFRP